MLLLLVAGPLCYIKCDVNTGDFRVLRCSQVLWRSWLPFSTGRSISPQCQKLCQMIYRSFYYPAWQASQLAWLEPQWETVRYCHEEDGKPEPNNRQAGGHCQSSLGFNNTSAAPQDDHPHVMVHLWSPNRAVSEYISISAGFLMFINWLKLQQHFWYQEQLYCLASVPVVFITVIKNYIANKLQANTLNSMFE